MDSVDVQHFLSGVIAGPRGKRVDAASTHRRYRAHVRTSATIGGVEDARNATIMYEVGAANMSSAKLLAPHIDSDRRIEAAYPTNAILAEDFVGLAKKYTNFSANFAYSSLAGMVERIAKGLAVYATVAEITSSDLRGNAALIVAALGTYDGPVNSLVNTVFIPRLVNNVITGDVFSILANAASGEGASVVTDILELDANTRQPRIAEVDADAFPRACVEALRILGANMAQSDQGPLYALALTRGIHQVVSVVGHTDEGGITRDLLRCGSFSAPFGGIHYGLTEYTGLPSLHSMQQVQVAGWVDAIALTTAGVVAHCDPGTTFNGNWFPTFYSGTSAADPTARSGEAQEGTPDMANRIRSQLLADCELFWRNYTPALAKIFGLTGDNTLATRVAVGFSRYLGEDPRHLRHASVAPWFWIEPTSLIPRDFCGSPAEVNGSGSMGGRMSMATRPAWEDIVSAGPMDTTFSAYHAKMTSPRRCWFFAHWLGHPENGLGAVRLRQADPNALIHPGGNDTHAQLRDRLEADLPITDYLWRRGQSPFCAPGELLNLSGTIGFMVRHLTFDDDGVPNLEHVPTSREFLDTQVTIEVGRPQAIGGGKANTLSSSARRARTRAAIELAASARRAKAFGSATVGEMPTLTTAPRIRQLTTERDLMGHQPGGTGRARESADAGAPGADTERESVGVPLNVAPQHQPVRAPVLPRQVGGAGGAAGVVPPAHRPSVAQRRDSDVSDDRPDVPTAPAPSEFDQPRTAGPVDPNVALPRVTGRADE